MGGKELGKKFLGIAATLALLTAANSAYAETQTDTLQYKDLRADIKLDVDWNLLDEDKAEAETDFINPNNSNYVAVRLEMWKDDSGVSGSKYDRDKSLAECRYTYAGAEYFKSRHSIDSSDRKKELVVDTFSDD
ncbi:hypothetical protein BAG01nite_19460 [Brevibacillus agri]|uniref:Uncharacterized protein n=1 Tax=Brevibacillus agri TaxID=51101 RepID=A0A3M8AWE9_9BACL|nr:hypothetical protein [Brevibacillus agri]MDR9505592.1 hypothetical protein [Brevibacillus agri]MED1822948.1 hypothetical protein [Brevibacillus agri]MED3498464.1 hypothetical protein [Brevibacillus agri]QAV16160.1 hypothetical protein BA6348_24575 [Brevibacillus agri]RNB55007.1 hypothetical protein EB820_12885 [Brevibacillus agri]